jgi:Undecaprenyl-phosphate galactose phosphotransferase WbaP
LSDSLSNSEHTKSIHYCQTAAMNIPYPVTSNNTLYKCISTIVLILVDFLGLTAALFLAYSIRLQVLSCLITIFPPVPPLIVEHKLWWVLGFCFLCLIFEGLYTRRMSFWREAKSIVKALSLAFLLIFAAVALAKAGDEISRTTLVLCYVLAIILIPAGRYLSKVFLSKIHLWQEPLLVLGAGKTGKLVAKALVTDAHLGYRIFAFLDDDPGKQARGIQVNGYNIPVIGGFKDAIEVIHNNGIGNVIIAAPGLPGTKVVRLVNELQQHATSVMVIPDLFGIPVLGGEVDYFFDEQIVGFRSRNNLANPINIAAKRAFDLVIGFFILLIILPVMVVISISIKLDSPGPTIFAGNRIGRGGKEFICYKFRTMYENNDEILNNYLKNHPEAAKEWKRFAKLKGEDPRVTRVGRFLRRSSLDELPQIINVLKGEMSLVGPRPYLPREKIRMDDYITSILTSRPGITGLWQVSGRNEIDFNGRLRLEAWYVRNWSLWLDITLLFRTISVVLKREGAY